MKRTYYLFNAGRMNRKDNTLCYVPTDEEGNPGAAKYLPIETVESLFCFGALDANAALFNFLGQKGIPLHFFDYYEHYTGSFMPRDYLLAGKMQLEQTKTYFENKHRLHLAQGFIEGAVANMLQNLKYYQNRQSSELCTSIDAIEGYAKQIRKTQRVDELMGLEGNCRQTYYDAFDYIIKDFQMGNRSKQPPSNEVNALVSFGNMMCYSLALQSIYHTQLNPTIGFLHEPGYRRYSLALDVAEVFKPILVDKVIFRTLNKREIQAKDFDKQLNGCFLGKTGKQTFVRAWEEKLGETIKHPTLKKSVSYKYLVRLECYKLQKYILEKEPYKPFKHQ